MGTLTLVARDSHVSVDADVAAALAARLEEARRLATDPADRAELTALRNELDELTPAWPAD
jgi:hypothetical protein